MIKLENTEGIPEYVKQPRIRLDNTLLVAAGYLNDNGEPEEAAWFEESAELSKELTKHLRGKGVMSRIIEEMADCYMVLAKLQAMYHISADSLETAVNNKYEKCGLPLLPTARAEGGTA